MKAVVFAYHEVGARCLQALLDGGSTEAPDLASWLGQLESQYAMAEQRVSHAGAAGSGPDAGPDQETTFF